MNFMRVFSVALVGFIINLISFFTPPSLRSIHIASSSNTDSSGAALTVQQPHNTSANWAGYGAEGGNFTGVSGTWTIPQNNGSGRYGADATWVGIGGIESNDLIQAGTQQTIARNGIPSYSAWFETLPQNSRLLPIQVNGGDSVTVSLSEQSSRNWLISLKDNNTGQSVSENIPYASSNSSAEWIEEAPSTRWSVLPLDNFGRVSFSSATTVENGKTVSLSQSGATPITLAGRENQALAVPSSIGEDGVSFSVERTQTPSTAISQSPTIIRIYRRQGFGRRGFGRVLY